METPTVGVSDREQTTGNPALAALARARSCLESALNQHESWRALRQLEAREDSGEWLDVMESDELRGRLTHELAAQADFLAWQFVDAAIACLKAGASVQTSREPDLSPATDDVDDDAAMGDAPLAVSTATVAPHSETEISHPRPGPPPLPSSSPGAAVIALAAIPAGSTANSRPMHALALRIPTLLPHDLKTPDLKTPDMKNHEPRPQELPPPNPTATMPSPAIPPPLRQARAEAVDENTVFDANAIGVEEADVQIVRRGQPAPSIVNTRLPPLPLSNRPVAAPPRPSRAPVAKWADNDDGERDDYRPIGSALDEAQVTIITGHDRDEASVRAERRALGVAPDREAQMRRFLKALSGE